jgi:DNA primase large subunit
MANHSLKTLARFPFMTEASEYIKNLELSIDNIMDNIAYSSAWTRGKQRLNEALDHGEVKEHGSTSEAEYINELLSYVIARILVSCIKDPYLVRRYALAEAVYANKDLENQDLKFISEMATQFGFDPINIIDNEVELSITDYLKYSINLRDPEQKWKLINRDVKDGIVIITGQDMARLIQEAIKDKIQTELPIEVNPEIKKKINPKIKDLIETVKARKRKFEARDLGKVSIIRFPPCMKQLLGMTQAGENVSHVGRFAMASFLHHIGLSTDQILSVFGTSPDFDVSKARYQIEHITGKISGTEYTPPHCDTMKSNSVCINPDSLCNKEWMNHPLTYYRIKGKPRKYTKEKTKAQEKDSD